MIYFISIMIINLSALGQIEKTDTVFILKENGLYYHAIFIDTNKRSLYYSTLEKNICSPFDREFYVRGVDQLRRNNINIIKHNIVDEYRSWHPLYLYKGEYYVYLPSDGMYNNWLTISDSIFLNYGGGEMICYAINDFKKINSNQFQLYLTSADNKSQKVNIYSLDTTKGIAIFEYPQEGNKKCKYELRVATNKIRSFPIIINYCKVQKQEEFNFDNPNYQVLINLILKNP
jgi:hypothetical protein